MTGLDIFVKSLSLMFFTFDASDKPRINLKAASVLSVGLKMAF